MYKKQQFSKSVTTELEMAYKRSIQVFENTEQERPNGKLSFSAWYEMVKVYVKQGKLADACEPLKKICNLKPSYRDARIYC